MRRVPLLLAIPLALASFALSFWLGAREHDFLAPPSATEIERVRSEVARRLDRPDPLFAVDLPVRVQPPEPEPPRPQPTPKPPPKIEFGDLDRTRTLDAWAKPRRPAASYVDLASRLESETHFAWALLAWERVLDHARADDAQREAALKGVRRLRATVPPWNDEPEQADSLLLRLEVPADRLEITRRAADTAATTLAEASSGLLRFEPTTRRADSGGPPELKVSLARDAEAGAPSVAVPGPETAAEAETAILDACFKLVASALALDDSLHPPAAPDAAESPAEALATRITRLGWHRFAESLPPGG